MNKEDSARKERWDMEKRMQCRVRRQLGRGEQSDKGLHSWVGRISSFHLELSEASKQM